jgi:hypothetical protein
MTQAAEQARSELEQAAIQGAPTLEIGSAGTIQYAICPRARGLPVLKIGPAGTIQQARQADVVHARVPLGLSKRRANAGIYMSQKTHSVAKVQGGSIGKSGGRRRTKKPSATDRQSISKKS